MFYFYCLCYGVIVTIDGLFVTDRHCGRPPGILRQHFTFSARFEQPCQHQVVVIGGLQAFGFDLGQIELGIDHIRRRRSPFLERFLLDTQVFGGEVVCRIDRGQLLVVGRHFVVKLVDQRQDIMLGLDVQRFDLAYLRLGGAELVFPVQSVENLERNPSAA